MRAAPVGVLYPSSRLDELIRWANECAIPTHGGQMAVCAAATVLGAVSAALDGLPSAEVLTVAIRASTKAESLRPRGQASSTIAAAIQDIYFDLVTRKQLAADEIAKQYFPNRPQYVVPLAIGLALVTQSAQQTTLLAANIGGDSDSVASIGGAIAGALHPETVNKEWFEVVNLINEDDLIGAAISLAALRRNA